MRDGHWGCDRDLEGIVGKLAHTPYIEQPSPWIKVMNPAYSQLRGRIELMTVRSIDSGHAHKRTRRSRVERILFIVPAQWPTSRSAS